MAVPSYCVRTGHVHSQGESRCEMYEATNVSRRLNGTAYTRIAGGSTFKFQVASHIMTKPKSQPRIVVLKSEALLESE